MANKDYYATLWLEKWASKDDIKKAYRKLAMQYHPDRNQWDKASEEKFKQLGEAYAVLSDDGKRQQYDRFGSTGGWWNPFGWGWFTADMDFGDIFESFFGWGGGWSRPQTEQRWEDLEYYIDIDLKTSIYGWKQDITFNKKETCDTCDWEGGKWKQNCGTCAGRWRVNQTRQTVFWVMQSAVVCPNCSWAGETLEQTCDTCEGRKRNTIEKTINLDIPAGIDDGMVIKMQWEWNDGIGTKSTWNLYVKFRVPGEEKWLKRDGVHLFYDVEIDVIEAILWAKREIKIPILWKREISIAPGTGPDTTLKLSGDGVKHIDSDSKWDLYIHLDIKMPKKLSKKERELYEQIAKEKKIDVLDKKGIMWKIFG